MSCRSMCKESAPWAPWAPRDPRARWAPRALPETARRAVLRSLFGIACAAVLFLGGLPGESRGAVPVHAAQGARVEETVFLPQDFYVGDTVELRVSFVPDGGMMVRPPSDLPVLSWIDIHDVTVVQEERLWEARIRFTSFAPGTRSLPPIQMGDVTLDALKIHTRTILGEESHEFYGIKNQLLIPGTRLSIAVLVAVLFFGPVFVLNFAGKIRRGFSSLLDVQKGRRPYRRLNRALKELRDSQEQMSSRRFYIVLEDELRRYLSERTGSDFRAITSSEFASHYARVLPGEDEQVTGDVDELLRRSDMVKFGGENSDKRRREADMDIVASAAAKVEHVEDERRRSEYREKRRRRGLGRRKSRSKRNTRRTSEAGES